MTVRRPHIRFAVTPDCNFSCAYCRAGGEGIPTDDILTLDEMVKIAELASSAGFRHIKLTGGEPLLRERRRGDVIPLIREISSRGFFEDIQLVTNGSLLSGYAKDLAGSGLDSVTVSLDAADPVLFKELAGRDSFYKVLDGIGKAKAHGLPITINSVIFKQNVGVVPELIRIAERFGARLKLLDYMDVGSRKNEWHANYVPLGMIREYLKSVSVDRKTVLPPGGLGTPMQSFILESGIEVLVKDASVGTNYNDGCERCSNYPCQDALISLRITADGSLKRCLIRDDNLVRTLDDLRAGDFASVLEKLKEAYGQFMSARYVEKAWKPSDAA